MADLRDVPRFFFSLIGIVLGVILSFSYYLSPLQFILVEEERILAMNFLTYLVLTLFVFWFFQILLGVILKKPYVSSDIYLGVVFVPIEVFIIDLMFGNKLFKSTSYDMLTSYLLFAYIFYIFGLAAWILIFSRILPFLTGYDTSGIDQFDGLSYEIHFSEDVKVDKTIGRLEAFFQSLQETVYIDVEREDHTVKIRFFPYGIENDRIVQKTERTEIAEFRNDIENILDGWKARNMIQETREIQLDSDSARDHFGRNRIRILSLSETSRRIKQYPKNHPYAFAILLAVLSAVVTIVGDRVLKMIVGM